MGCCDGRSWKREEKADHRFDFLDLREFRTNSFGCRMAHFYVWVSTFRSFAILGLDIYTAIGLLILKSYKSTVTQQTFIAHNVTKWIFAGCIILSVVLLIWDWIVAIRIMRSKNISFAFTNVIANRVYSLRSYDHHCLFYRLGSSSHRSNKVAFWVFFSFIGWKRLLLSEGPRQAINALTVFSVLSTRDFALTAEAYANITPFQWTVLSFMALSLIIWLFSFARFCMAAALFLPLLCHLQGGLTEFVVRKIDKRIAEIIEKARKKRLDRYAQARRDEGREPLAGGGGGPAKKSGLQRSKSLLTEKPTLPTIPMGLVDDDEKNLARPSAYALADDDADSIYSHGSMTKSGSAYSLSNFGGGNGGNLPRSDTLPLYRPSTADSRLQREATLPVVLSPESPPSLSHNGSNFRPMPGAPRPLPQKAPSYHRKESYGQPPPPRPAAQRTASAGQGPLSSRPDHPYHPQSRPVTGQRRDPPRQPVARSTTNAPSQPAGLATSRSNHSLASTHSNGSRQGRTLPF